MVKASGLRRHSSSSSSSSSQPSQQSLDKAASQASTEPVFSEDELDSIAAKVDEALEAPSHTFRPPSDRISDSNFKLVKLEQKKSSHHVHAHAKLYSLKQRLGQALATPDQIPEFPNLSATPPYLPGRLEYTPEQLVEYNQVVTKASRAVAKVVYNIYAHHLVTLQARMIKNKAEAESALRKKIPGPEQARAVEILSKRLETVRKRASKKLPNRSPLPMKKSGTD